MRSILISIALLCCYLQSMTADLILVEESHNEMLCAFTPCISQLSGETSPLLLSTKIPPNREVSKLINEISPKNSVLIGQFDDLKNLLVDSQIHNIEMHDSFFLSTIALTKLWQSSEAIVIVSQQDNEGIVYASTLAAHSKWPIVVIEENSDFALLSQVAEKLQSKKIWFVGGTPEVAKKIPLTEVLSYKQTMKKILETIGTENIHNFIVTTVPKEMEDVAWAAPYLSWLRKAPLIMVPQQEVEATEKQVRKYIKSQNLQLRSLTILADYSTIATRTLKIANDIEEYEIEVEPFTEFSGKYAIDMIVARLPLTSSGLCLLNARNIMRERILSKEKPDILMIANPNLERSLPLAEAVSKATVSEFRNANWNVNEFYNLTVENKNILEKSKTANVIIYEGHAADQKLFYVKDDLVDDENSWRRRRNVLERKLHSKPFVILQSCVSLEQSTADLIFKAGSVGLLGTVTRVHSASGSTFVKAFCDASLYHQYTLGEALRYAKNYYLCLLKLKEQRQHREMLQGQRVALSFSLWGDPEAKLFPGPRKYAKKPVKARFSKKNNVRFFTPEAMLKKNRSHDYLVQAFPNSELAGIVRSIKNQKYRRIMSLYFAQIPIPDGVKLSTSHKIHRKSDTEERATFLLDRSKKFIYVLYFPKKGNKNEKILLQFRK